MQDETRPRFTLYFSPTSYYSHKALLALFEKGELFTQKKINVRGWEAIERWYMLMNPAGLVPVLEDRGKPIPESEDIIDYLDKEVPEPQLIPPLDTELGQEVDTFRKYLYNNVPIEIMSYGTWYHPHLSPGGAKSPKSPAEWDEFFQTTIKKLGDLAEEHEDLREAYLNKLAILKPRFETVKDPAKVQAAMDSLQPVLDEVEKKIIKTKEENEGVVWLCGTSYTAADITLTVLLNRLTILGLDTLYFSLNKRRQLFYYWERAQSRLPFIKIKEMIKNNTKYV